MSVENSELDHGASSQLHSAVGYPPGDESSRLDTKIAELKSNITRLRGELRLIPLYLLGGLTLLMVFALAYIVAPLSSRMGDITDWVFKFNRYPLFVMIIGGFVVLAIALRINIDAKQNSIKFKELGFERDETGQPCLNLDFRVADGEDSTMKEIIQSLLGILGFGLIRHQNQNVPLNSFFSLLKQQGFAPKHVIDVGANHGNWTRVAFNYFPDAYYTLVEPQDWLKTYVQDLLARKGKIRWIGAGVGDKPGTLPFHVSHRDDSSTFVTPEEAKAEGFRQIEVPVTTLNDIARSSDAPFPDMVKIDAEGLDLRVLAGASEFIGKTDIFLLEAAICPQNLENTLGNVIQTMAQADYRIIDITELNRSPKCGALWLCEVAFLRNGSRLLDRLEYE